MNPHFKKNVGNSSTLDTSSMAKKAMMMSKFDNDSVDEEDEDSDSEEAD